MKQGPQHKSRYPESDRKESIEYAQIHLNKKGLLNRTLIVQALKTIINKNS